MPVRLFAIVAAATCAFAGSARAESDVNWGLGSEFGRGVGLGLEREVDLIGRGETVVAGVGFAGSIGYSSFEEQTIYSFVPGVALGYRKYLGGFFIGPSIGVNATVASSTEDEVGAVHLSGLLDLGYRWRLGRDDRWSLRAGVGVGVVRSPWGTDGAMALTLSIGL